MQILYDFVLRAENWYHYRENGINFPYVIKKHTKFANLQGHIFHILEHFATKLCNCTKFRMLFIAVVMNFIISILLKILSIMQWSNNVLATAPITDEYWFIVGRACENKVLTYWQKILRRFKVPWVTFI